MTLYLSDRDVSELLSLPDAIACVDRAFRLLADGRAVNAVRRRSAADGVVVNVMWALAPSENALGVKEYPVVRREVSHGAVLMLLLHAFDTGELLALVQADRLGQLRTGAASAVATRALARPDSEVLALYGTGFQAEMQVLALREVLPRLRAVLVVGRDEERRTRFVERLRGLSGLDLVASTPREAAAQADVIVTATGASAPVVQGAWLRPGTHVNAVGSNVPAHREVDRDLLVRATRIVVDDRDVAAEECGDLIANDWDQSSVVALGDVLLGRASARSSDEAITLFESQGLALQDVVCGALLYQNAVARGLGQRLTT